MLAGTLSCTELMELEDNDIVRGTPDSVTSIPSDIPTLDENPTLDDLIYDLQKHQTPSKSQKTKTPDKSPVRFKLLIIGHAMLVSGYLQPFTACK